MIEKREVLITIRGDIVDSIDSKESVELKTEGLAFKEGDQDCLSYEETELFGMEGTKTTILIREDCVVIIRLGSVNSELEFVPEKHSVTLYATPYGEIQIGIMTNSLNLTYTPDHWIDSVLVDYSIEIGNEEPLHNTINIKVTY